MAGIVISENELLKALADERPMAPDHAMTRSEIEAALGLGSTVVKKRLRALIDDGRVEVWWTMRRDTTGHPQRVPAYTMKAIDRPAAKPTRTRSR